MNVDSIKANDNLSHFDPYVKMECELNELSKEFNLEVNFNRFKKINEGNDSCIVILKIYDKTSKAPIDTLIVASRLYFDNVFKDCKNVLSYSTGVNLNKEIFDNYYGDLIIADLNFDNKDDIAIIYDSGFSSGPFYYFYLQEANKKFRLDKFLTDSMIYFPGKINKNKRTLATYGLAGACGIGEHIYRLNKSTGEWKQVSHRKIGNCK